MKKILLALLVLAVAVPAMAAVNITVSKGTGGDTNLVTIGYQCTNSEEVRAFALNVAVSRSAYWIGTAQRAGTDYYVTPTNITFKVVGPNTVIDKYGLPMVTETTGGGIVELASLYASNDPCVAHRSAPASSGNLVTFRVNCAKSLGGAVTVTVTKETVRGGVVLKNPDDVPVVNLPAVFTVCACTYPACWNFLTQCHGSTDGVGKVGTGDFVALQQSWNKTYPDVLYNPCADFGRNGSVKTADFVVLQLYWNKIPPSDCPTGDINHKYCP